MNKIRGKYLLVLIAACGMMVSSIGMVTNVTGLFFTPVAEELGLGVGAVSMTLTVCNLVFAVGGMLVARFVKLFGFKRMLWIGIAGLAGGTAALSLVTSLPLMYALSAVRGFCGGFVGMVAVTTILNNWFREKLGFVSSIAMGCSGIGGAVFSAVLSAIIQSFGWRAGYIGAGVIMLVMDLPALLLPITFTPEESGLEPLGGRGPSEKTAVPGSKKKLSVPLFIMAFTFAVTGAFSTAFPQHFPGLAENFGLAATVGSAMLSVSLVTNTVGKLIFGTLADRIGAKVTIPLYCGLVGLAGSAMFLFPVPYVMIPAAGVYGLCYSLSTLSIVMLTKDAFGAEQYARAYPRVNLGMTVSNAVGSSLIGFLFDASGSYLSSLVLTLVFLIVAVSMVGLVYLSLRRKKQG